MALAISTGFVVDDAIVVMENCVRLMEIGVPRLDAAYRGASEETGPTVLSMSLFALSRLFIPILFIGRHTRDGYFHEFAVTMAGLDCNLDGWCRLR